MVFASICGVYVTSGSLGLDSLGGASHGVSSLGHSGVQGMGTNLGLLVNGGGGLGGLGSGGSAGGVGQSLSPHDLASALGAPPFVPSNSVNYGMRYKRSDISSGTSHWRH